jgi:hypothetical protein
MHKDIAVGRIIIAIILSALSFFSHSNNVGYPLEIHKPLSTLSQNKPIVILPVIARSPDASRARRIVFDSVVTEIKKTGWKAVTISEDNYRKLLERHEKELGYNPDPITGIKFREESGPLLKALFSEIFASGDYSAVLFVSVKRVAARFRNKTIKWHGVERKLIRTSKVRLKVRTGYTPALSIVTFLVGEDLEPVYSSTAGLIHPYTYERVKGKVERSEHPEAYLASDHITEGVRLALDPLLKLTKKDITRPPP